MRAEGDHIAEHAIGAPFMSLHANGIPYPNRAEYMPIIQPHNLSLGKAGSRIGQLLGNIDVQALMMGLDIQAQEKAIFPDTWILGGDNGETPELLDGEWKDGRTGHVNRIRGAKGIGVLRTTPDQRTGQMVDRLERNVRVSAGLIPQSGGENWGSLRTGRAMDSMTAIAIDPGVQELHEIMEAWLPHQNEAILRTYKGYWGRKSYSMSTGRATEREPVTFIPNEHIEIYDNVVNYSIPGADITTMTQVLGSLVGAEFMSKRTARRMHPSIEDGDAESDAIEYERAEDAFRAAVYTQIQEGTIPLIAGSKILTALKNGDTILEAIEAAEKWMREQQAHAGAARSRRHGRPARSDARPRRRSSRCSTADAGRTEHRPAATRRVEYARLDGIDGVRCHASASPTPLSERVTRSAAASTAPASQQQALEATMPTPRTRNRASSAEAVCRRPGPAAQSGSADPDHVRADL